jgi:hypothetical protein
MQFPRTNSKRRLARFRIPSVSLYCAAVLLLCSAQAQNSAALGSTHTQALPAPPASQTATPPSTSEAAPSPATVNLADGKLTVSAQNSDLTAILQQVARTSGMSIEGLGKTTRVFGVYGPGNPRDVLTELLDGSGYNFVILGGGNGIAPAKLMLTEKPAGPPPPANASPADDEDTGDSDIDDADQEPLGPGAIPHPSPQFTDNTDPETRAQRNLERLQQMRQQMIQQQQQANPQ